MMRKDVKDRGARAHYLSSTRDAYGERPKRVTGVIPSLFAADHARVAEAVTKLATVGAEHFHIDIMDGRFVPLIGLSPGLLAYLVQANPKYHFYIHLMTEEPGSHLKQITPGAASITFHLEADRHPEATLQRVRASGALAGIAINPATPPQLLTCLAPFVDIILVMSAAAGHEKQAFLPVTLDKVREVRTLFPDHTVMVDGKVDSDNIAALQRAGADAFVCGRALFSNAPEDAYIRLAELVSGHSS